MTEPRLVTPLRILFAPETFNLGETSRAVEIAKAARADGHDVHFVGYSRRFAAYVTDAGFDLELLAPELSDHDADRMIAADQGRSIDHPFTEPMVRERVASELVFLRRWRPDAIVIGSTFTQLISARIAGVPIAYVRPFAMSRAHLRGMRSAPLLQTRSPAAASVNRLGAACLRTAANRLTWMPAAFRRVASEYNVALPERTIEALDADLNLIATAPSLTGEAEFGPDERLVGPIWARSDGEVPEALVRFRSRGRPAVYLGLGSSASRRLAIDLLTRLGELDLDVISTAGGYLSAADRSALPDNAHVYDHLPAAKLGDYVDAAITHGGEGTVQTTCSWGVPFAGIGLQFEQRWNIDACERRGNAIRFTTADLRRNRLPLIVERLLDDTRMRGAAEELAREFEHLDGATASVRALTEFVATRRQPHSAT